MTFSIHLALETFPILENQIRLLYQDQICNK